MKLEMALVASAILFNGAGLYAQTEKIFSLDDIQFWCGDGTNRAAMIIQWSSPEVFNNTTVPAPMLDCSIVWGYRWNGESTADNLFKEVMATDPQIYGLLSEDTGYGSMILGLGYDLNNNRIKGIKTSEGIIITSSHLINFDGGLSDGFAILSTDEADKAQSLEIADIYWGGLYGPCWEVWQEKGAQGGFLQMPQRGNSDYWTPDDPQNPWTGTHGEWTLCNAGISSIQLHDGSWIGFTITPGGLNYSDPTDPGTIAYYTHKAAPDVPNIIPSPTGSYPYAQELVEAEGPLGPQELYSDPTSILGTPTTIANNLAFFGPADPFHIKIVEPAYNLDLDGNKTILTLSSETINGTTNYGSVTVKFDHPITDDPANPYGIDFQVFGNTFYTGNGFVNDSTDLSTHTLTGNAFTEPVLVSVSPDGKQWYTYQSGPYCDDIYPTQGYEWDQDLFADTGNGWSKKQMDFTRPVNPAVKDILRQGNISAANAIKLYAGSGGGTGFDLAESGFDSIQYIRVSAAEGFSNGELDAFSDVRPALIGEGLSVFPANLESTPLSLQYNLPETVLTESTSFFKITFNTLDIPVLVTPSFIRSNSEIPTPEGNFEEPIIFKVDVKSILDSEKPVFNGSIQVNVQFFEDFNNLRLLVWNGSEWEETESFVDLDTMILTKDEFNASSIFALVQQISPVIQLKISLEEDKSLISFDVPPNQHWSLQRSFDLKAWETVTEENNNEEAETITIKENFLPEEKAYFYRLQLDPISEE